jgi:hypothetical protein
MSNIMKIRALGAELFLADGRADRQRHMTKLIVAFRNFAKAPKNRNDLLKLWGDTAPRFCLNGADGVWSVIGLNVNQALLWINIAKFLNCMGSFEGSIESRNKKRGIVQRFRP